MLLSLYSSLSSNILFIQILSSLVLDLRTNTSITDNIFMQCMIFIHYSNCKRVLSDVFITCGLYSFLECVLVEYSVIRKTPLVQYYLSTPYSIFKV